MNSYLDVILSEEKNAIKSISRVSYIAAKKSGFTKEIMGKYINEIVVNSAVDNDMITGMCIVQVRYFLLNSITIFNTIK